MSITRTRRRMRLRLSLLAAAAAATAAASAALLVPLGQAASAHTISPAVTAGHHGPKPTIVLVHGAWASTSSWDGVISRLHALGYTHAPLNKCMLHKWCSPCQTHTRPKSGLKPSVSKTLGLQVPRVAGPPQKSTAAPASP